LIAFVVSFLTAFRQFRFLRPLTKVAFVLAVAFLLVECGGGSGSNTGGSGAGTTSSPGTPPGLTPSRLPARLPGLT
jgi:hypothetical protein